MSAMNGKGHFDTASLAHVAAAHRLASALVASFELCEELGAGLSEVQKIAFVEAALLRFDGFADQLGSLEGVGELLRRLGQR